jgi:hypothetical protein
MADPDPVDATSDDAVGPAAYQSAGALLPYRRLAVRLKHAHEQLRALRLPEQPRADLVRRLLVITAAARHDPADASERLDRFLVELQRLPAPDPRSE